MALTGTYLRNVDEKNRIAVPKQLREEFDEGTVKCLYVAPGTDRSLSLYSPAAFEALAQRLARKSAGQPNVRNYLRLFYARAQKVDLDGQGRIRIPERLAEFAQLGRDVVLIGVQDHVEIWNSDEWERFLEKHSRDFDALADAALE
ncbi:MAG TPA: division/cell wall cluster transcriptional repressor MraZ [Planctomycetaceae bacterium]|nr:division/cell wall cluster transcriptional repressor MraZ [Planctomycetaceae bacterium]HIQ23022.1 division/cell wall cluster transcriptional repressor MraZ [Planctomycetota bacterium]